MDRFYKSRAEFLNSVYNTNFKQHYQAIWEKPDGKDVWMVRMDGKIHHDWRNTRYKNTIVEEYLGNDSVQLEKNKSVGVVRVAVCITAFEANQNLSSYEILGTYELDLKESDLARRRVWRKVSEAM